MDSVKISATPSTPCRFTSSYGCLKKICINKKILIPFLGIFLGILFFIYICNRLSQKKQPLPEKNHKETNSQEIFYDPPNSLSLEPSSSIVHQVKCIDTEKLIDYAANHSQLVIPAKTRLFFVNLSPLIDFDKCCDYLEKDCKTGCYTYFSDLLLPSGKTCKSLISKDCISIRHGKQTRLLSIESPEEITMEFGYGQITTTPSELFKRMVERKQLTFNLQPKQEIVFYISPDDVLCNKVYPKANPSLAEVYEFLGRNTPLEYSYSITGKNLNLRHGPSAGSLRNNTPAIAFSSDDVLKFTLLAR